MRQSVVIDLDFYRKKEQIVIIFEVYRNRPKHLSHLSMGQWFCNAFEEPNSEIYDSTNIAGTLHLIEQQFGEVSINKLMSFNEQEYAKQLTKETA